MPPLARRSPVSTRVALFLSVFFVACLAATPALAAEASERPLLDRVGLEKQPPEVCAMLDNPRIRPMLDGLLMKLLIGCGREHELGQVESEWVEPIPAEGDGPGLRGADVPVNDPSSDVGGSSKTQSETSIARNPTTGTLCSGYNDSWHELTNGNGFSGFSRSTDDGASFTDLGSLGAGTFGDPSIVWSVRDNAFYYAVLSNVGLSIFRSNDDCLSFQEVGPIHVGNGDDKELISVDNDSNSPWYGRLHNSWTDFSAGGIWNTYSDDGGVTWSTPVRMTASGNAQGAWPVVGPGGVLYVGWVIRQSSMTIEIVRSTDGGDTFTLLPSPAANVVRPEDASATSSCGRSALNGRIRYLPSPQLAVGSDGVLHTVYSYDPDGAGTGDVVDVFYRRSTDQGATWQPEIRLNDDATTNDQYYPTLSVDGANIVSVGFYDRRLDPNNLLIDYYRTLSADGGASWLPNERVSDVSTPVVLDPNLANCYHGDYDQQVQAEGRVWLQWSDDRGGTPDVFVDALDSVDDFALSGDDSQATVCAGDDAVYDIDVLQFQGFADPVTLAVVDLPLGFGRSFSTNPVNPPGTSELTVTTGGGAAGTYEFSVEGTSGAVTRARALQLRVFDGAPLAPTLETPPNGANDVALTPLLDWQDQADAASYFVEVAEDGAFANIVWSASVIESEAEVGVALDEVTTYFWRVTAENACSSTPSTVASFTTRVLPPILLVDDDDNSPDVRSQYTAALDALGLSYDIFDTNNSDNDPQTSDLGGRQTVIWFTGDEFGGAAGPSSEGETRIANLIDQGGCFLISAQDWFFDKGLTPLMTDQLGVEAITSDVTQTTVTGGNAYAGLGPWNLDFSVGLSNFSDRITPSLTGSVAFDGDQGFAGVANAGPDTAVFLGFPLETLELAERQQVLQRFFAACDGGLFEDDFEDGDLDEWDAQFPAPPAP